MPPLFIVARCTSQHAMADVPPLNPSPPYAGVPPAWEPDAGVPQSPTPAYEDTVEPPPADTKPAAAYPPPLSPIEAKAKFIQDQLGTQHPGPAAEYQLFLKKPDVMARPLIDAFHQIYGDKPIQANARTHLNNIIASSVGWPSTRPSGDASHQQLVQAFRLEDFFKGLSGDHLDARDKIADKIIALGGERPEVTVLPVVYAVNDHDPKKGGVQVTVLFKVKGEDGQDHFVDTAGLDYDSAGLPLADEENDEYRNNNGLPRGEGHLVMPLNGRYEIDQQTKQLKLLDGQARIESTLEWTGRVTHANEVIAGTGFLLGSAAALGGAGILNIPGGYLAAGSASWLAATTGAAAAGVYGVASTGLSLARRVQLGDDLNPISNPQAGLEMAQLALGTIGLAQVATVGAAQMLRTAAKYEQGLFFNALDNGTLAQAQGHVARQTQQLAIADELAALGKPLATPAVNLSLLAGNRALSGIGTYSLASNWSEMTSDEKATQAVRLLPSFLGWGVNAAVARATLNNNAMALQYGMPQQLIGQPSVPRTLVGGAGVAAAAGSATIAGTGALAFNLGLDNAAYPAGYVYRGLMGTARSIVGAQIQRRIGKLEAGDSPQLQLNWLERNLVGKEGSLVTGAGVLGIGPADRLRYKGSLDQLRLQVESGTSLDTAALTTLRGATPLSLWSPHSLAGRLNEAGQYATLGMTNGYVLKWLADGKFDGSNLEHIARVGFFTANLVAAGRGVGMRYAINDSILPEVNKTWAMRNAMNFSNSAWALSAIPHTTSEALSLASTFAQGGSAGLLAFGAAKTTLIGSFGVAAALNLYRDNKQKIWPDSPAPRFKIDPMLQLGGSLAGYCLLTLAPRVFGFNTTPQTATPNNSVPPPSGTPAAPRSDDDAAPDAGPTGMEPSESMTPAQPTEPAAVMSPAAPNTTTAPATPTTPTVTIDNSRQTRSLWNIAVNHLDTLLTSQERATALNAKSETALAMKRLMEINPQYHFRPELNDGKVTGKAGDPDTLRAGWELDVDVAR